MKMIFIIAAALMTVSVFTADAFAEPDMNQSAEQEMSTSKEYKKDPSKIKELTDYQKYVTQHDGTEPAFQNKYWNNKEEGIYVDVVSGEPLFSSTDKFDSGTGWPSFTKPLHDNHVEKNEDRKLGMARTEVRSKHGDSHLGHVFDDGPQEAGGKRYCINSASLRFIPKADLVEEGYGEYTALFDAE